MPDLSQLLQSPYLWAAGGLALFLLGLAAGLSAGAHKERRRLRRERERQNRAGYYLAMGLSSVIAGNPALAIPELRRVVEEDTEAIEVYILLGDLYRERGRVEQAIRIHGIVLKRPGLSREHKTVALAGLAKDYAKAGFVDRALGTFEEVAGLDPTSLTAHHYLERLHEETGAWDKAVAAQQRLLQLRADPQGEKVLGFLHWRVGEDHRAAGDTRKALRAYSRAIQAYGRTTPAHVASGEIYWEQGDLDRAEKAWLAAAEADPERAVLALERLDPLWRKNGEAGRTVEFADSLMDSGPNRWRLPLFLARRALEDDDLPEAVGRLRQSLEANPRSLQAQGMAWRLAVPDGSDAGSPLQEVRRQLEEADAFAEPQVCMRCRYRTTELLWRCPHCHAWDPFVIERG